jgi:protocatechuate 3,4-dioxygenase beta subunit
VIASVAMLLLPTLAWLLVPRPSGAKAPAFVEETAVTVEEPPPVQRAERPVRPTATSVPSAEPDDAAPVTGTVLDPDGHPVAGAFVACDDEHVLPATSTDEHGRFRLPPEASGCLAVTTHPSFISSDRVRVTAGRDNVLTLNRGGAIEGEVVDDRGAPVGAYTLAIESYRGASGDAPFGQVKSIEDARGAFLWDSLPPGAYVLTASADGRPPTRSRSVDVEMSRTTRHVRIVLARGATLSGRVVDADGKQPLAGATVGFDALTSAGMGGGGYARTDESGAYTLEGAPPGPFSIRIAREGYVSKIIPGLVTRGADTLRQDVELRRFVEGGPRDELAGIGAVLAPAANGVMVGSVVSGGPAESAGMMKGDRIVRIDGVDATAMPLSDCIQRLRGAEGSIVSVQVDRGGKTVELTIRRRIVAR